MGDILSREAVSKESKAVLIMRDAGYNRAQIRNLLINYIGFKKKKVYMSIWRYFKDDNKLSNIFNDGILEKLKDEGIIKWRKYEEIKKKLNILIQDEYEF